jgi:hypothetical protein
MKSTGVGQNRQYPSTFAPINTSYQNDDSKGQNRPRTENTHESPLGHQRNRQYNRNGGNCQNDSTTPNPHQPATGFHGVNNSYRPNRETNQSRQHQRDRHTDGNRHGMSGLGPNSYDRSHQNYQPRQVQKSADLESEYSRLNRQDEMTHFVEDPTNPLSTTDLATTAAKEQDAKSKHADLPVLTLKNSLSKISFCDRECFNVNDNPTKEAILKYIETKYTGLKIIDNQYVLMKPHMLKNITYHEHILTTFTNGNPYLLFLTRIDNVPCSIFIDRKVKDGYCYPKIHCVQYKFAAELFDNETVFTGELVRDVNRNFQYLISDLLVHNGEYIKHRNILSRFQTLHNILDQQYTPDTTTEICPIYCKRLFQYADIKFILQEFLPVRNKLMSHAGMK